MSDLEVTQKPLRKLAGKIIGIDPGKMNGIAIFNGDGTLDTFGQMTMEEIIEWSNTYGEEIAALVVEDYIIFKKRALQQAGSRGHAQQVIGMMKVMAQRTGAKMILQKSDILPIAQKLSQKKMPSDHSISHQVSAYNHAFYWMCKMGIVRTPLEVEINGD